MQGDRGRAATALACLALLVIATVSGFTSLVLVSTLGLVVVLVGLFLSLGQTAVVSGFALALAVVLAVQEGLPDNAYRVLNVVVGCALGLAAAWSRALSVRRIQRLREQEAAVLAGVPDALVMLDAQGRVVQANPALSHLLPGTPQGGVLHDHLGHVRVSGERCEGGCVLAGRLEGADRASGQGDLIGPRGREVPMDWVATRSPQGYVVVSLRDAVDRIEAEGQREMVVRAAAEAAEQRRVLEQLGASLRPSVPVVPGLDLDVWTRSSDVYSPSGGDLVDVSVLPDGRVLMIIVDALGHGVTSVRDAWKVLYVTRSHLVVGAPLGEVVAHTAATLAPDANPVHATLLVATLDPRTGEVFVAGGGHPPPLVLRSRAGTGEWMEAAGRGVGTPDAGSDAVLQTTLQVGDCLLLYTDGLVEATRDVVAGLIGMRASALALRHEPADGWARRLVEAVLPFGHVPDDSVVLFARRTQPDRTQPDGAHVDATQ